MRNLITLVLGGGRGSRLYPLTKFRAKPAVSFAGKYRLIDIPLSNCINSGLNRVYVLTQFLSVSLHRHLRQTYRFDRFNDGFVELLAAQETGQPGSDWYQGTADAVRKNLAYIQQRGIDHVLILSGDQLYRMDYRELIRTHEESGADVTIAALPVTREAARSYGVMRLGDGGRVTGFMEKPQTDDEIDRVRTDPQWMSACGIDSRGRDCIANMGIYLFNRKTLVDLLTQTSYADFGKEIFPEAVRTRHVQMHLFDGYWEDIGTIKSFYQANLALVRPDAPFDLMSPESPFYSRARFLPPTILDGASVKTSLIADGCRIGAGAVIENSIVGLRCILGENVTVRDSILMGADEYETEDELREDEAGRQPPIGIGAGTVIEGAIVDKQCRIGRNVRIVSEQGVENSADADDCIIRDRIPIVLKSAMLRDGWHL